MLCLSTATISMRQTFHYACWQTSKIALTLIICEIEHEIVSANL